MEDSDALLQNGSIIQVKERKFKLLKQLGMGGTSSVWLGVHSATNSTYAIKIMFLDNNLTRESSKREIASLDRLKHSNIIRLLDATENVTIAERKASILVMECAPRGELFEFIKAGRGLKENGDCGVVHRLFTQMVDVLEFMHDKKICHRDIKPENILLDFNYETKLADMGFSQSFMSDDGEEIPLEANLGSQGYHAPEITRSRYYTENVDIFSLGVVLFIMYAGFPPFRVAKKSDWWFHKLLKKDYSKFWSAHERRETFPRNLKKLLQGMLAVDPRERISIQKLKKSSWFNQEKMSDEKYRSFMHKLYKKMHPQCTAHTPCPEVQEAEKDESPCLNDPIPQDSQKDWNISDVQNSVSCEVDPSEDVSNTPLLTGRDISRCLGETSEVDVKASEVDVFLPNYSDSQTQKSLPAKVEKKAKVKKAKRKSRGFFACFGSCQDE